MRMAVLKGKDPLKIIEEMDAIDEMGEFHTYFDCLLASHFTLDHVA